MISVEFPVYLIGSHVSIEKDDAGRYVVDTGFKTYILDNPNLEGSTLSARRRKVKTEQLYRFRKTIFDFAQLVKQKGKNWYMDSTGKLFHYKKEKYYPITYREIIDRRIVEGKGTVIKVKGIEQPILASRQLALNSDYVGLILIRGGYIIYEFTNERKPDTRKKI